MDSAICDVPESLCSRSQFNTLSEFFIHAMFIQVGPEQKGVEQSITVIISFHNTFITKVDRAYRCTCFYMEADKVVTSRFDVSMLPTTDLIDTARMPLCTYTVRRASVTGSPVSFATVGEPVFHVWQCESDMFSMLVHSCFVDDGNGQDRKPLIDENGCSIDEALVPNLTYNPDKNMAFSEVSVFKFADKVSTYFQCAVSTCMNSEGMCQSKTPPRCGSSPTRFEKDEQDEPEADDTFDPYQQHVHRRARSVRTHPSLITQQSNHSNDNLITFKPSRSPFNDANTMDLSANPIVVLDLDENTPQDPADTPKVPNCLLITGSFYSFNPVKLIAPDDTFSS
ncbi:unnamed protein product [Anisakis simplex]|uniref:ZP domain-containing protein n=1 Tax=Anisakis simplex TaxID=6269 RepID=A0A0M3JZF5_ANISI|nr:unnamed protein product [Anisakis simplex]